MRHASRRFSAEGDFVERLEGRQRRELVPLDEIIPRLKLDRDDIVLDLGAGIGYFTFPAARAAREVVSLDIEPKMLELLSSRKESSGSDNVHPLRGEMTAMPVGGSSADHVLAAFVYHEVSSQKALLRECARVLRPKGTLTIIDFQKRETPIGPPVSERMPPAHVIRTAKEWFSLEARFETEVYYLLRFVKL